MSVFPLPQPRRQHLQDDPIQGRKHSQGPKASFGLGDQDSQDEVNLGGEPAQGKNRMDKEADGLISSVVPHGPMFHMKSVEGLGGRARESRHSTSEIFRLGRQS